MAITDTTRKKIFKVLNQHLNSCVPPMVRKRGTTPLSVHLIGNKPVPYGYDKKIIPGMFFAAVEQRKDSVAFHFFPSYYDTGMKKLAPSLYSCLKGKTCFHFRKEEQISERELKTLLKAGVKAWRKLGYLA